MRPMALPSTQTALRSTRPPSSTGSALVPGGGGRGGTVSRMPEVVPVADRSPRRRYRVPSSSQVEHVQFASLIEGARSISPFLLARLPGVDGGVFCVGDLALAKRKSVAIVGARKVSDEGARRARQLARELVRNDFVVVSGLAYGVDISAHTAAIEHGGRTIAVIGTPLDTAYPAAHAAMQEQIYRDHLLVSPYAIGTKTHPGHFPMRNKVMAALSDATCIVEASDTSGSLHQARECVALGRWLFILRSVLQNTAITWPHAFLNPEDRSKADKVRIVDSIDDITSNL